MFRKLAARLELLHRVIFRLPAGRNYLAACLCGGLWLAQTQAAPEPFRWRWSNPWPHGNNIVDMAFSNGFYIQVSERGQIYTSGDLQNWIPQGGQTTRSLRAVAFFKNRIVIAGEAGTILSGESADELKLIELGTSDWIEDLAVSLNQILAVGDNAAIYTSADGLSWKRQTAPFANWLRSAAFGTPGGSSLFVVVGENGAIATSADGVRWQRQTSPSSRHLNRAAWINNQFLAVGDGGVAVVSANGTTWQPLHSGATNTLSAVAGTAGSWLFAGDSELRLFEGSGPWSDELSQNKPLPAPNWNYLSALWDGVSYLAGGRTGLLVEGFKTNSTSGPRFWLPLRDAPRDWLWEVQRFPNSYIAVGDRGTIMTSLDGIDWDLEVPPDTATSTIFLGVGGRTNLAVAVGHAGTIIYSPDEKRSITSTNASGMAVTNQVSTLGILWNAVNPRPTDQDLQGITAHAGLLVVTGGNGSILTSPNGTNWTKRASPVQSFLSSVASFSGGLVAVGSEGTILFSPDAATWTRQPAPVTDWIYRVRHLNGMLVAAGQNGALLTSSDGRQWIRRTSGTTRWLNDVVRADDRYVVAGTQGTVLVSTNLVNWTNHGTVTQKSLYGLATHNRQLLAVGIEGVILRSRIVPHENPVRFLAFPRRPAENVFLFAGELDQRFTLDHSTNLLDWTVGPLLEIYDRSGTLLYQDDTANAPGFQFFRARPQP